MKKIIASILLLAMLISSLAGCVGPAPDVTDPTQGTGTSDEATKPSEGGEDDGEGLTAAVEYLRLIYREVEEITAKDFKRTAIVSIGGVKYPVTWSADVGEDLIKIVPGDDNTVTVDVNEEAAEETPYVLTATVSDDKGNTKSVSWNHILPAALNADQAEIVDMAYALEDGETLPYEVTLTGRIISVDTAWSDDYQNITVTIIIAGREDKPIQCYRLKGDGAKDLKRGDTITVTGTLKNYSGTIEFDAGCILDNVVVGEGPTVEAPTDPKQIVDAAYNLAPGMSLEYTATLSGKIISIDSPWSEDYGNITVTIVIDGREDKPIQCFRLKGDGADKLTIGDTITVTGDLKNYNGTIEFVAGCTLDKVVSGGGTVPVAPSDPKQIVDEAYALADGTSLLYSATLTGKIVSIDSPYSEDYGNITVTIQISGREDKPIQCYRLKGDGVDKLAIGDTITVTGYLKNYSGTIEFNTGCTLDKVVSGGGTAPVAPSDPKQIVDEAYALEDGVSLPYNATLTGKIISIDTPYSEDYQNITVTIAVSGREDKPIQCYRLKGDGADKLAIGDTITVTGTLKNYSGTIEFVSPSLNKVVSGGGTVPVAPSDPKEIVDAAYALTEGAALPYNATLTGKIVSVDTPYDEGYQNITVTIAVSGREDKPIQCFRLKGDGADKLAVGDTITVTGNLKNYGGTIEFNSGCTLDKVVKGDGSVDNTDKEPEVPAPSDPKQIVDEAYALESGASLPYKATLTGKLLSIDTPYNAAYSNITVTIAVSGREDKPIQCFRLKGDGADKLAIGDTITVTGTLMNYNGTIEFASGCTLDKVVSGGGTAPVAPSDPKEIVDAAYALEVGEGLPYNATLTGTIVSVDTPYDEGYKNITVTIAVPGREDKPIQCFRLKGDGAENLAVGDTITVTGTLMNYNGTIEFGSGCVLGDGTSVDTPDPDPTTPEATEPVVTEPVVVPSDPKEIVDAAYDLESGASLPYSATLTGKIISIDTPYSDSYKNITVTIAVSGREDKPIQCYRLKGDGADALAVGDTITVTGTLMNYNGTIEFASGCTLDKVVSSGGTTPVAPSDPKEIVDAAYALEVGAALPYNATLTGKIVSIDDAYSESYGNITVTIAVSGREDKPIQCFRLKGDGADTLEVGDTITVTGTIKNYGGTIEFVSGCTLDNVVKGETPDPEVTEPEVTEPEVTEPEVTEPEVTEPEVTEPVVVPSDPKEIVDAAYALESGASLPYSATLTGEIISIDTPYSDSYKNITVTIAVEGREDKPIQCYRLKGDGADALAVGDTITVTGTLMNYNGTIEFASGCTLDAVVSGGGTVPVAPEDPKEIVDAAYALEVGEALPYNATLTGEIVSIDEAYSESYGNITVTIAVSGREDKPIQCFRLKGDGADTLEVGDTITVTGTIKNYSGTIEFVSGCTLDNVVKGETPDPEVTEPEVTEPEVTEPEVTEPEVTEPEVTEPEVTEPEVTEPEVTEPEVTEPEATEPEVTEPEVTEPEVTEPEVTEPEATEDPKEIVDAAYALESGASLPYSSTLTGEIISIDTPYSDSYKNITVTIAVEGREDKPIQCYRLKGDGADALAVGDTITVTGTLMNYNGTIEFASGCTLDAVVSGGGTVPVAPEDPKEIVDAAYALEVGEALPYNATLTGKIVSIDTAYSESYGNITVTIAVEGCEDKPIQCYRLKGDGAATLEVGDTITVTGTIKNYGGTIEFVSGCTLDNVVKGETPDPEVTEPEVTEPEATEPEATEPEVTEPEATKSANDILLYTPSVDGVIDDAYLQSANIVTDVNSPAIWVGDSYTNTELTSTAYFLHDGDYLYLAAVVNGDKAIIDTGAADWVADSVELWVPAIDGSKHAKIPFDAYCTTGGVSVAAADFTGDASVFDLTAVEFKSVVDAENNSYVVEAKIPLAAYKGAASIPVGIQLNDVCDEDVTGSTIGSTHTNFGIYGVQAKKAAQATTLNLSSIEPEVTEPEATEPEVTEPEATEPEVTEPEVTEPEATEPKVGDPWTVNVVWGNTTEYLPEGMEVVIYNSYIETGNADWDPYKGQPLVFTRDADETAAEAADTDPLTFYNMADQNWVVNGKWGNQWKATSTGLVLNLSADDTAKTVTITVWADGNPIEADPNAPDFGLDDPEAAEL